MRKKIGLIVAFLLMIGLIPIGINNEVSVKATEKSIEFEGYYPIRTASDLNSIRYNTSGKYYLANDIVFSDYDFAKGGQFYNNGSGWIPFESFSGILDGNGYSIKNLKIISSSSEYVGLFKVNLGTVRNLGLDKINYNFLYEYKGTSNWATFYQYTGGLVADNRGVIENCYNTGDITVNLKHLYGTANISVAGIAGRNSGKINKCYNESPVKVIVDRKSYWDNDINIAGIVGDNKGTITNSYNTASIGYTYNNLFNLITGHMAGGIVGYNSGIVRAVYNIGKVIDNFSFGEYTGGIVGYNVGNSSVSEAYYYDKSCGSGIGNKNNQKVTKKTDSQLKQKSTYSGFDFGNVWQMGSKQNYQYATLRGMKKVEVKNIKIKTNPNKLEYSKGENLNLTGGVLEVIYDDDTRKEIELSQDMISGYDNQKVGSQELTVTYNNKTTYFNISVKNNAAPVITADNVILNVNDKFDVMNGVTAIDEEDGVITNKIQVKASNLDTNKVGIYTIVYEVSDNNGNSTTIERRVEVIAKPVEEEITKPTIYAEDITIELGQEFEPLNYVHATDLIDDSIECEVIKNEVDIYNAGEYEVAYRAMNSMGAEAIKTIKVTVVDNRKADKPIIRAESRCIKVNETYNVMEGVIAIDERDGDITDKVEVAGYVNTSKAGEYELTYSVTNSENITTEKEVMVIVRYAKEDLNKDGLINYEDLKCMTDYYNITSNDTIWESVEEYDMNNDGIIDISDYVILNEKIVGYVTDNINLDFNNDGIINEEDLQCIIDKYNMSSNDDKFNWDYDLNVDGIVDICDYVIASEMIAKVL